MQLKHKRKRTKNILNYVIFMGPSILFFTVLFLIPLFTEIVFAFTDWNGIDRGFNWVGLYQFKRVLQDDQYWYSMWFTIKFSFFVVIFSNLLGFFWAYLLSRRIPLANLWKALIYLPRILGGVVLGYLWRFIFQEVFVQFGEATGWSWFSQMWFTTASSSFWALVIVMTWTLSGYLMVIYNAGFSAIDDTFIEAATIDGASKPQILFKVIIPLLMPSITRCLFIAINWAMLLYDTNLSLTNGNPFRLSEGVTMNIYSTAFQTNQMTFGAAKSFIFVLILVVISLTQVKLTSSREVQQ